MCFFLFILFICQCTISSRNNTSIFHFSILFDGKVNLVVALWKSLLYTIKCIINIIWIYFEFSVSMNANKIFKRVTVNITFLQYIIVPIV